MLLPLAPRSPAGSYPASGNTCWGYCNYKYVNTAPATTCSNACLPNSPCGSTSGTCQAYQCTDGSNKVATAAVAPLACPTSTLGGSWAYNLNCQMASSPTCSPPPSPNPPPPKPPPPPPTSPSPPPPAPPPGVATCMSVQGTGGVPQPVINLPQGTTPGTVVATCSVTMLAGQFITVGQSVPGSSCSGDVFVAVLSGNTVLGKAGGLGGGCASTSWTALTAGVYTLAAGCSGVNYDCKAQINYQLSMGTWSNLMSPLKVAGTTGVYYGPCAMTNGKDNTGAVAGSAVWRDQSMPMNAGAYWQKPGIATGLTMNYGIQPIATASDTYSGIAYCVGQPGSYRIGGAPGTSGTQLACYDYAGNLCKPGAPGCGCDFQRLANGAVASTQSNTQQVVNGALVYIPSQQSWNCLACPPPK